MSENKSKLATEVKDKEGKTFNPLVSKSKDVMEVGELLSELDNYELNFIKKVCDMLIAKNCM